MYKLVLIFAMGMMAQNEFSINNTPNVEPESKELKEWVYWDAFSNTFNETADYWKAESAALEAERIAEDRTDIDNFLKEVKEIEKEDKVCKI